MIDPRLPKAFDLPPMRTGLEFAGIVLSTAHRGESGEPRTDAHHRRGFHGNALDGSRQMAWHLHRQGWCVGRKRVRRLMRRMACRRSTGLRRPANRISSIASIPICCGIWLSSGRTMSSKSSAAIPRPVEVLPQNSCRAFQPRHGRIDILFHGSMVGEAEPGRHDALGLFKGGKSANVESAGA